MRRFLLAVILSGSWTVSGQSSPPRPEFEVAEIKPADPSNPLPRKGRLLPGGRVEMPGMTMQDLIMMSYGVKENMISGLPKWGEKERYDIVAKAPPTQSNSELRLMFRSLLADRFKLAIHNEEKVMPAYVLTLGKKPLKVQEASSGARQTCNWSSAEGGLRRRECHSITMAEFAATLPGLGGVGIDLPVVDETGLKGAYDLQFEMGYGELRTSGGGGLKPGVDSGPTIFEALDRIGLKLESRKMSLPMIVIDHAEPPSGSN